jgi:hypothetical protein
VCALHFTFSAIYNKDEATAEPNAVSAVSKRETRIGDMPWRLLLTNFMTALTSHLQPFSQLA